MTFSNYPGSTVGRAALALIRADGDTAAAVKIAQGRVSTWGGGPLDFLKANIAPGTTTDATWGGPLAPEGAASFLELVARGNLLGRIPGFATAPANAALVEVAANGNAYWTGESFPKPVTAARLSKLGSLAPCKVTALVAITDELERASGQTGEQLITNALSAACGAAIDAAFSDPVNVGIDGVKPPYVGAGATPVAGTGDLLADIATAVTRLKNPSAAVIVLNSMDGQAAAAMRTANGALAFPDISARGGTLGGLPAYTSDAMPPGNVLVIDPSRVFLWQGGLALSVSKHALVELDTEPDHTGTDTTVKTSLWDVNMRGILVEMAVSWMAASGAAVAITNALAATAKATRR